MSRWGVVALVGVVSCAKPPVADDLATIDRMISAPDRAARVEAFLTHAQPRVYVEGVSHGALERHYGGLLPIGLYEFDFVRVVVEADAPDVRFDGVTAFAVEGDGKVHGLSMFVPTRELLTAFTDERLPGERTRYRLASAGLPLFLNLATAGVLELLTVRREAVGTVRPSEAELARAAPLATRLSALLDTGQSCGRTDARCERIFAMPRVVDGMRVRAEVEVRLSDPDGTALRLAWRRSLDPGQPLARRLAEVFEGEALPLHASDVVAQGVEAPVGCRSSTAECALPTADPPSRAPASATVPERRSTAQESLEARPTWAHQDSYAASTHTLAFSLDQQVSTGPLQGALLRCELQTGRRVFDSLWVEARVGTGPIHGTAPRSGKETWSFLVPLVSLDPGEALHVEVLGLTRRGFGTRLLGHKRTPLGSVALRLGDSFPLEGRTRGVTVSCAAPRADVLDAKVAERLAKLRSVVLDFEVGVNPIDLGQSDWGRDAWRFNTLRLLAEDVAGLVGWSDPRLLRALPAVEHYRAMFDRYVARYLALHHTTLPEPGAPLSFQHGNLRVLGPRCKDALNPADLYPALRDRVPPDGCVVAVEVTARDEPLDFSPRTGTLGAVWSPDLVWSNGHRVDAWVVGVQGGATEDITLAPGESTQLLLAPPESPDLKGNPPPIFLVALDALNPTLIRLE